VPFLTAVTVVAWRRSHLPLATNGWIFSASYDKAAETDGLGYALYLVWLDSNLNDNRKRLLK
jgi:hypothetical protein